VQQGRRREFTITKKCRETIDGILSEPVGEKFLTMLEKPKEERVGEAELPKERCAHRSRRISWCRLHGRVCNSPDEYEVCPDYVPPGISI